jgi:TolA-binding protein
VPPASPAPVAPATPPAAKPAAVAPGTKGAPVEAAAKTTKAPSAVEIESLLKLAPALTDRGDYQAAEIAFYQVLNAPAATPSDLKSALLGLARMHRKRGTLTKAVAIYERYLKDYPVDERAPDALLDLGRTLRALGVHKLAIGRFYGVLNSTLKVTGGDLDHYQLLAKTAQFEIAQTHFEAGEFADAHKFFTRLRLLDLAPADRARAHFMAAYSQRLQGNREGAATNLRSFIEQSPEDENVPEARYLLALTLRELNRPQEALTATLELLRVEKSRTASDPKRWAYWQRRTGNQLANEFYEAGDILNAQAIYGGLVELSPEPAWRLPLTYQIALCAERLGMLDRARASYQAILDAAGATPPPEFAELARMATWRLEHLGWTDRLDRQVASLFTTTTGKPAPPPAPAPTATTAATP